MNTKAGYVAIIGKPNAGKSTFLNAALNSKLSIVSSKPQTTRKSILGILSEADYQIVFIDTPGIMKPHYLLQEKMMSFVGQSIYDADVLLFIHDVAEKDEEKDFHEVFAKALAQKTPKILLLNKIDLSTELKINALQTKFESLKAFEKIIPISSINGINVQTVIETILSFLPEHPKFYNDEDLAVENERFFVSEIIREKILELYRDEIPYSSEVKVEQFIERENNKSFIEAFIYVERDSQRMILIGKQGAAIKKLGETARKEIETFLDKQVYLELRVKVKDDWRSNEDFLKNFGYDLGKNSQ